MRYGLRIPSYALGPETATLQEMGAYLRKAEDLGFEAAFSIDHLLLTPPAPTPALGWNPCRCSRRCRV